MTGVQTCALPICNFLRLLCIIIAAEMGGQASGNYVHESSIFSLIPYLPAIGGLIFLTRWLEKKFPEARPSEAKP